MPNLKIKEEPMKRKTVFAAFALACAVPGSSMLAAANLQPGDLVVSEVLANPGAVADSAGEWFEIYNRSANPFDLSGLVLRDAGSNAHTIETPLLIRAGDYLVLGRNGDRSVNGGYTPDYVYRDFTLANTSDSIILEWEQQVIFELSYTGGDSFGESGVSRQLDSLHGPISAGNYSPSEPTMLFGAGDLGTPGFGFLAQDTAPGVSEVPIPAAGWLFVSGLGMLAGIKRRRIKGG